MSSRVCYSRDLSGRLKLLIPGVLRQYDSLQPQCLIKVATLLKSIYREGYTSTSMPCAHCRFAHQNVQNVFISASCIQGTGSHAK